MEQPVGYKKLTLPPKYLIKAKEVYPEQFASLHFATEGTFNTQKKNIFEDEQVVKDTIRLPLVLGAVASDKTDLITKRVLAEKEDSLKNTESPEAMVTAVITGVGDEKAKVHALIVAMQSDTGLNQKLTYDEAMAVIYFSTHNPHDSAQQGGFFYFASSMLPQLFFPCATLVSQGGGQSTQTRVTRNQDRTLKLTATSRLISPSLGESTPDVIYSTDFKLTEKNGQFTLQRDDSENGYAMWVKPECYEDIIAQATESLKSSLFSDEDLLCFIPLLTDSRFLHEFKEKLIQSPPSSAVCEKIAADINLCHGWDIQSPAFWQSNKSTLTGLGTGLLITGIVFGALLLALGPVGFVALGAIAIAVGAAAAVTTVGLGMGGLLADNNRKHPHDLLPQLESRESSTKTDDQPLEEIKKSFEETNVLEEKQQTKNENRLQTPDVKQGVEQTVYTSSDENESESEGKHFEP